MTQQPVPSPAETTKPGVAKPPKFRPGIFMPMPLILLGAFVVLQIAATNNNNEHMRVAAIVFLAVGAATIAIIAAIGKACEVILAHLEPKVAEASDQLANADPAPAA